MVLFVDFSSPPPPLTLPHPAPVAPTRHAPNRSHPLSALLATYPFLSSLARFLDHNDLYNLSSACWQFHANLSAYRKTLLSQSLRCSSDIPSTNSDGDSEVESWRRLRGSRRCVRDLVKDCLRCNKPMCRNCIYKPHVEQIHSRHRRLCQTCRIAPSLVDPAQKRCSCMNGGWLCMDCAPAVIRKDNISRMWSAMHVREHFETGDRFVGCAREREGCEGLVNTREVVATAVSEDAYRNKVANGAPVELGVEMAYNKWALVDEWQGKVRSWCGWCNAVILSREDEREETL